MSIILPFLAAGCEVAGEQVELQIVPPLAPVVGAEMAVAMHAYAMGRPISWSWRSLTNAGLGERRRRPVLTIYGGGTAIWRWTPIAEDTGLQEIEFTARAGAAVRSDILSFEILPGERTLSFREPIGAGTTLDLRNARCASINIRVESSIYTRVELGLAEAPENARVAQTSDLAGVLSFCPDAVQIAADTVYPMVLLADGHEERASKSYVIVLRRQY